MKYLMVLCLGVALLTGCGKGEGHPSGHRVEYPALTESPPPPLLPEAEFPEPPVEEPVAQIPAVENEQMKSHLQKEDQIKGLRKYAAQAALDDPFALTEEEIDALSKADDVLIY